VIDAVGRLRGRVVAATSTGDVSQYRYASRWKRLLCAIDHQPAVDAALLPIWQAQQHALNLRLLGSLAAARAASM
jgi:hypothetical protein